MKRNLVALLLSLFSCVLLTHAQSISYQGTYSPSTTYAQGDIVLYGSQDYVSASSDNVGNTPGTSSAWTVYVPSASPAPASVPGGSSTPKTTQACSGTQALSFASYGDTAYEVTLTGNCTFTVSDPGTSTLRHLTLIIHPAGYQATLPLASSSLVWTGSALTPSTSTDTIVVFSSAGSGTIYAGQ